MPRGSRSLQGGANKIRGKERERDHHHHVTLAAAFAGGMSSGPAAEPSTSSCSHRWPIAIARKLAPTETECSQRLLNRCRPQPQAILIVAREAPSRVPIRNAQQDQCLVSVLRINRFDEPLGRLVAGLHDGKPRVPLGDRLHDLPLGSSVASNRILVGLLLQGLFDGKLARLPVLRDGKRAIHHDGERRGRRDLSGFRALLGIAALAPCESACRQGGGAQHGDGALLRSAPRYSRAGPRRVRSSHEALSPEFARCCPGQYRARHSDCDRRIPE